MSTSKGKNTGSRAVSRTWTDQQDIRNHKRLRVTFFSILLIAALAAYFYLVQWPTPTKSFIVACAFPDYGTRLPNPLYAEWDLSQVEELASKKSVVPWENLQTTDSPALKLQSYDTFQAWLNELVPRLQKFKVARNDTLIVYIRGQAIAQDTSVVILAGEAPTKDSETSEVSEASKMGQIPIREVLQKLQALPAQNIILLADICDITSSIELDLPKNPVTARLQEICSTLKQNDKNVFVITSKADYQPTHISHLRKKTLLQSACEFALDQASDRVDEDGQGDGQISLTEFYERIARYCYAATGGVGAETGKPIDHRSLQIPILMRVGDKQNLLPESVGWNTASKVFVARTTEPQKDPIKPDAEQLNSKKAEDGAVAARDEQPTVQKNDPTAVDPSKETEEKDPKLLYWKIRDELEKRKLTKWSPVEYAWSPVEYAPLLWNLHQRKFLTQNEIRVITSKDDIGIEARGLLGELQQLGADNVLPGSVFASAYESLKNSKPIVWEQPDVLPQSDQKKWKVVSEEYRKYVDACAELPDWILWTRGSLDQVDRLHDLVGSLTKFQKTVPKSALLDAQSYDASSIQSTIDSLRVALKEKIDLVKKTTGKKAKLGWKDEHRLEQVWMSPLLSYEERKELFEKAKVMTIDNIAEPNQASLQLDLSTTLSKIVVLPNVDPALVSWERTLEDSLKLVDVAPAQTSPTGFADRLRRLVADSSKLSEFQKWHLGCLCSLLSESPNETMIPLHGIVLPVSKTRSLALELAEGGDKIAFGDQPKRKVVLSIKRRDGDDVSDCWLSWKFLNDGFRTDKFLSVSTESGLKLNEVPQKVRVSNKVIELTLSTEMDSTQVTSPVQIQFTAAESKTGDEKTELKAFVHPLQPDRIELVVRQILGEQRKEITKDILGRPYLPILAIDGAQAKFEFAVKNLSSKPKRVDSRVYVVPLLSRKRESPATIRKLIETEGISPSFEGSRLELAAGTVDSAKKLEMKALAPSESKVKAKSTLTAKHPFECLVFEFVELDSDGKPQVAKTSYQFIDLVGQSPFSREYQIVQIDPKNNTDSDPGAIELHFEMLEDSWQRYGHSELSIDVAEVTNEEGAKIASTGTRRSLKLTKDESRGVLAFSTAQPEGTNVVVHLTVGGYPRAIAYLRDPQGTLDVYNGAFVWLDEIQALAKEEKPILAVGLTKDKGLVFPAIKDNVNLACFGLLVQARMDRPSSDFDMGIQLFAGDVAGALHKLESDRNFDFTLKAEDGVLGVSAKASDLEYVLRQEKNLDGLYRVEARSAKAVGSKSVVFDHTPPEEGMDITANEKKLYKGEDEAIHLKIVPIDKESGIKEAFLSVKRNNSDIWEEKDIALEGLPSANGIWKFKLTPEVIPKGLPKSRLKIVAKTIDVAGNSQLKHDPLIVDWEGEERPKKAPKQP